MTKIDISALDHNLLADLDGDTAGCELYEAEYSEATVSNQHYQVVFHAESGRAGIVFCGSGSSGSTHWTDASSAEDAMERYHNDEMSN